MVKNSILNDALCQNLRMFENVVEIKDHAFLKAAILRNY